MVTAAFLVLLGYLGLHVSLCCLAGAGSPAVATATLTGHDPDEHTGDCPDDHGPHTHGHGDVVCAPPRADDGGALAAVPAVLPTDFVLRRPLSRIPARRGPPRRSTPGRAKLIDLCIART